MVLDLVGAYGRNYATRAAARIDWEAGKDFMIMSGHGPYCSIRDMRHILSDGFTQVRIFCYWPVGPICTINLNQE